MKLFDSHTHLQFPEFDKDRDAVLSRASEAGVEAMLLVGTDVASSEKALALAEQNDGLYRVSLRSKGPSVGALARDRGGGGHELAAGFTAEDVEQTVIALREELKTA